MSSVASTLSSKTPISSPTFYGKRPCLNASEPLHAKPSKSFFLTSFGLPCYTWTAPTEPILLRHPGVSNLKLPALPEPQANLKEPIPKPKCQMWQSIPHNWDAPESRELEVCPGRKRCGHGHKCNLQEAAFGFGDSWGFRVKAFRRALAWVLGCVAVVICVSSCVSSWVYLGRGVRLPEPFNCVEAHNCLHGNFSPIEPLMEYSRDLCSSRNNNFYPTLRNGAFKCQRHPLNHQSARTSA